MELVPCNSCGNDKFISLFEKQSSRKEVFSIVKCKKCRLVQVNPQPTFEEVLKYYSDDYFTKRTDRGYDNYYSDSVRSEIERVFKLNLEDLKFFEWESKQSQPRRSLDIGCAAGYFVNYMKSRDWDSYGIEIAEGPANFAIEKLGLQIFKEDFLEWDKSITQKFDLITLWASIEHLHKPRETLEKIFDHLKEDGRLLISTCRYGVLAKWNGLNWRYLNVPEHLYYYSLHNLIQITEKTGFRYIKHITYGSGMTAKKDASLIFRVKKKLMDNLVKFFDQGDMMAIHFRKPSRQSK
jgi:2-polyprenyl-3-methyl-5-hydroxy-6-metoxy-1,4-benzoquinol methylase